METSYNPNTCAVARAHPSRQNLEIQFRLQPSLPSLPSPDTSSHPTVHETKEGTACRLFSPVEGLNERWRSPPGLA